MAYFDQFVGESWPRIAPRRLAKEPVPRIAKYGHGDTCPRSHCVKDKPQMNRSAELSKYWRLAVESVSVLDVTSQALADKGFENLVWDASAMPAGGHYFPVFLHLIQKFESAGRISPEKTILVETTTGTAGIALNWVASKLGYRVILFMPEDMPRPRIEAVRKGLGSGSRLITTPRELYVGGMVKAFRRFLTEHRDGVDGYEIFPLDHSRRPEAIDALRNVLEIVISQIPKRSEIDIAVGALGNGTSSTALFDTVRSASPRVKCVGVEPAEAPVSFLGKYGRENYEEIYGKLHEPRSHELIGTGGWGVRFPHLDLDAIDEIIPVESVSWLGEQSHAKRRGLDLGNSSAACQAAISRLAERRIDKPFRSLSIRYDKSGLY